LVFGILIDVPLIVGGFLIMFRFRKRLALAILRVKQMVRGERSRDEA
jgi:hypothetical protein